MARRSAGTDPRSAAGRRGSRRGRSPRAAERPRAPSGRRVDERGGAPPVLVRRVRREDLRHDAVGARAVEQARRPRPSRVRLRQVGEREEVGRIEERRDRLRVAGRLREAVVEAADARARDVDEEAVEDAPALLVGVESLREEVAQEPADLRDADAVDATRRRDDVGVVLEVRGRVADRREPETGHDAGRSRRRRPRRSSRARKPPASQTERSSGRAPRLLARETPFPRGMTRRGAERRIPLGQDVRRAAGLRRRVARAADRCRR